MLHYIETTSGTHYFYNDKDFLQFKDKEYTKAKNITYGLRIKEWEDLNPHETVKDNKIFALAKYLKMQPSKIRAKEYNKFIINPRKERQGNSPEYLVVTSFEGEEEEDHYLECYIKEVILANMKDTERKSFNKSEWKSDNRGERGSLLATYDGKVHEETVNEEVYDIYRTN